MNYYTNKSYTAYKPLALIILIVYAAILLTACDTSGKVDDAQAPSTLQLPSEKETLHKLLSSVNLPGANQVITDGVYIYFNNGDNSFIQAGPGGEDAESILSQHASWPVLTDDLIFYATGSSSGNLAKMQTDGSSQVRIGSNELSNLVFYQNMIYAIEEPQKNLIRVKSDGTGREQLSDFAVSGFILRGNSLYIAGKSAQDGLLRYDLKNSESSVVLEVASTNLQASGDYLYYSDLQNQYHLYAIDLSNFVDFETLESDDNEMSITDGTITAPVMVLDHPLDRQFAVNDGSLYFVDSSSQQQLYKIELNKNSRINREDAQLMVDDAVDAFSLLEPFIYYRRSNINSLFRTTVFDPRPSRIS